MTELRRSANVVCPGARVPPTVPWKSTSAVNTSLPSTRKLRCPAAWPGVKMARMVRSPLVSSSPSSMVWSTPGTSRAVSGCATSGTPKRCL